LILIFIGQAEQVELEKVGFVSPFSPKHSSLSSKGSKDLPRLK